MSKEGSWINIYWGISWLLSSFIRASQGVFRSKMKKKGPLTTDLKLVLWPKGPLTLVKLPVPVFFFVFFPLSSLVMLR